MIEYIGFLGAILATLTFAPQVLKTLRTQKTRDLSLSMLILSLGGNVCWIIYSIGLDSLPIFLSSIIICIMLVTLILVKIRNDYTDKLLVKA